MHTVNATITWKLWILYFQRKKVSSVKHAKCTNNTETKWM